MDYETLDWDAEAKRIARAFSITQPCEFVVISGRREFRLAAYAAPQEWFNRDPLLSESEALAVRYGPAGRDFRILEKDRASTTKIYLDWSGNELHSWAFRIEHSIQMVKGMFFLDLLTLEVEAALRVTITAHQKLEWALEYEERYEF